MNVHRVTFVRSAVRPEDFPRDGRPQVIFAGKSNVGKSSVINRILNRKNFARVGAQPGKTVHINFFDVDQTAYFVDLPGYGYAKVSKAERARWGRLMEWYFGQLSHSAVGIHIVDIRHAPTADDITMANWFRQSGVPCLIVANKCDKIKPSQRPACLEQIRQTLALPDGAELLPFSAAKGEGREELFAWIEKKIGE